MENEQEVSALSRVFPKGGKRPSLPLKINTGHKALTALDRDQRENCKGSH